MQKLDQESRDLPKGISLRDIHIYRFHSKRHLNATSSGFFQTFLDSEHSATKPGRFCASHINPGFFFGLTPETSLFEFLFHNKAYARSNRSDYTIEDLQKTILSNSEKSRVFITCKASLDNILDLCCPTTLGLTLRECFGHRVSPERLEQIYIGDSLLSLASSPKYGDTLTNVIGQYAWEQGFNGIKFLSARAIESMKSAISPGQTIREKLLDGVPGDEAGLLDELLRQLSDKAANLIVFRGAYLAQCVESFCVQELNAAPRSWVVNDLWRKDATLIERETLKQGGLSREQLDELCCNILVLSHAQIVRRYVSVDR
jgi:hypothetical protein